MDNTTLFIAWDGKNFYNPIIEGSNLFKSHSDFEDGITSDDILLRYVGFTDKNDLPIKEGDIDLSGYVVTYLANLQDGYGMTAGWYLQRDNFESWSELECYDDIEIVGNIFQTPEKAINNCNTNYIDMFIKLEKNTRDFNHGMNFQHNL